MDVTASTGAVTTPADRLVGADRVLAVLAELATYGSGVSLEEITAAVGSPKPTVHRALGALRRAGFATQDGVGRYVLGDELLRLAFAHHEARPDHAQPLDAEERKHPARTAVHGSDRDAVVPPGGVRFVPDGRCPIKPGGESAGCPAATPADRQLGGTSDLRDLAAAQVQHPNRADGCARKEPRAVRRDAYLTEAFVAEVFHDGFDAPIQVHP